MKEFIVFVVGQGAVKFDADQVEVGEDHQLKFLSGGKLVGQVWQPWTWWKELPTKPTTDEIFTWYQRLMLPAFLVFLEAPYAKAKAKERSK